MTPEQHLAAFLQGIGYSADPECADTARRVAAMLQGWSPAAPAPDIPCCAWRGTTPILLREVRFYSLCAHHLLPFFGHADIAHLPDGRVAGLSHLSGALRHLSRRPQIQERLTEQLADHLHQQLGGAILVRLRARHLCMEMRGDEVGATVETCAHRGDPAALTALQAALP